MHLNLSYISFFSIFLGLVIGQDDMDERRENNKSKRGRGDMDRDDEGDRNRDPNMLNAPVETRMITPSIKSAKQHAFFAAATVCPDYMVKDWSCKSCQIASPEPLNNIKPFFNETTGSRGYFAINHWSQSIIISFRGPGKVVEFTNDLEYEQVPFEDLDNPKIMINKQFKDSLDSISFKFLVPLQNALNQVSTKDYSIILTGVSLGGADASLAAIRINRLLGVDWSRISIFTYGQPRTGNRAFARWYDKQPVVMARVVNTNDIVPHYPPASTNTYTHHQNELFIDTREYPESSQYCDTSIYEDPSCANSIKSSAYDMNPHFSAWKTKFTPEEAC